MKTHGPVIDEEELTQVGIDEWISGLEDKIEEKMNNLIQELVRQQCSQEGQVRSQMRKKIVMGCGSDRQALETQLLPRGGDNYQRPDWGHPHHIPGGRYN